MVKKKLWQYVEPFSSDTGALRTDRRTDRNIAGKCPGEHVRGNMSRGRNVRIQILKTSVKFTVSSISSCSIRRRCPQHVTPLIKVTCKLLARHLLQTLVCSNEKGHNRLGFEADAVFDLSPSFPMHLTYFSHDKMQLRLREWNVCHQRTVLKRCANVEVTCDPHPNSYSQC